MSVGGWVKSSTCRTHPNTHTSPHFYFPRYSGDSNQHQIRYMWRSPIKVKRPNIKLTLVNRENSSVLRCTFALPQRKVAET
jgi:hypothetical protein